MWSSCICPIGSEGKMLKALSYEHGSYSLCSFYKSVGMKIPLIEVSFIIITWNDSNVSGYENKKCSNYRTEITEADYFIYLPYIFEPVHNLVRILFYETCQHFRISFRL